jgi:tetratricopeptide (TPR) repeat protein
MKGDLDGAIVKLREAHRRGPNFADPLELWGEALMRKRDLEGAVMKFAEADEHAPRWGRNHLRWGQALAGLGRWEEARTQWRAAAGMDLSTADRARLGQVMAMRR